MGDPSGIGPEIIVKALSDKRISRLANITVIGDYFTIEKSKKDLGSKPEFSLLDLSNVPQNNFSYGQHQPSFGRAAVEYIDRAVTMLKRREADALVTAPINKASVRSAGFNDFEGHTEYLAAKTDTKEFAMMFVGKKLKIALVTRHIALKDVSCSISTDSVHKTIMLTTNYLRKYFKIKDPKIGVAGLNPHAGDNGLFGDEETKVIIPGIKLSLGDIKNIYGPISPDTIFYEALRGKFDAVIAMYHDQGLTPFKMLYFRDGVNLTLGLPFIRTSPDHGTAFDIAGKGIADPASMKEAILLACRLSEN